MISGVGEMLSGREVLDEAKTQLEKRGEAFDPQTPVGCMVETPAAVTICDLLAEHADFFSIGTNDLVQYLLAVDRINNQMAYLYEPHHPAVIRAVGHVAEVGRQKGVEVSVCGEMAGDPHFTALLMGLGIDKMSVAPPLIPELKFFARRFTTLEAENLREEVDRMEQPSQILVRIKAFHDEKMAGVYDVTE
jgi:phosphotransferase system enzyme I (PtsI)